MFRRYYVKFFRFSEDGSSLELWRSQYFPDKDDALLLVSYSLDLYDRIEISEVNDKYE